MSVPQPQSGEPTTESAPGPEEARLGPIHMWVLYLAGPLIWSLHFVLVYGLTEAVCGIEGFGLGFELAGYSGTSVVVIGLTVVAMVALLWFTYRSFQEWTKAREEEEGISRFIGFGGVLLALLFVIAIASVGFPALALSAC